MLLVSHSFKPLTALQAAPSLLVVVTCANRPEPAPVNRGAGSVAVELVDSVVFDDEIGSGNVLRRVVVRSSSGHRHVPGLLTLVAPVVVGDSVVLGIGFDSTGALTHAFRYSLARHAVDTLPLPADYSPTLTVIAIAPDGRHIAYVRFPGDETATGVVRVWPAGPVVVETPVVRVPAGDGLSGAADWLTAETFHLFIDIFADTTGRWLRFTGKVRSGLQRTDTIVVERRDE